MDPLSVVASVAGILSIAGQVSLFITSFVKRSKHAPKAFQDIQEEIDTIKVTLEQLQRYILRKAKVNSSREGLILVDHIVVILASCVTTFSELEAFMDSLRSEELLGITDRLRWSMKAPNMEELIQKLQNHKLSLTMMLTILQSQSNLEAEAAVTELTNKVDELLRANQLIAQRLMQFEVGTMTSTALSLPPPHPTISSIDLIQRGVRGFAFEEELNGSWVYKRAYKRTVQQRDDTFSIMSAAGRTASWSVLSGLSLSDISNISVLALPIYAKDIAKRNQYAFGNAEKIEVSEMNQALAATPWHELNERSSSAMQRSKEEKKKHTTSPTPLRVFGADLMTCIAYAGVPAYHAGEPFPKFWYRLIPRVVAECIRFVREEGILVENIFYNGGSASRIRKLQYIFDNPPDYGKYFVWTGYTMSDGAGCLVRYLRSLPQPIVPWCFYWRFRNSFRPEVLARLSLRDQVDKTTVEWEDFKDEERALEAIMYDIPSVHRDLVFLLVGFMSDIANQSKGNKMNAARLVAIFQPSILSDEPQKMSEAEYRIANSIVTFMVEHAFTFSELKEKIEPFGMHAPVKLTGRRKSTMSRIPTTKM